MSQDAARIERYDPARHETAAFKSGNDLIDSWLRRYAGQSGRRDAARTFVATFDGRVVRGYHSLVAGQLEHAAATAKARKGMSRHFPIPVALIARLGVGERHQGHGLGAQLLADALRRIQRAAVDVAVRAVVVHAIDDGAADFYRRYGFRALAATPRTVMVTLDELRAAGLDQA